MALKNTLFNTVGKLLCPYTVRNYAVGYAGKKSKDQSKGAAEKMKLDIEKDTHKLVTYVCGTNLLAEGGEDTKIKPDEEYPDWLWKVHIGKPRSLDELDPETKEYWLLVRKLAIEKEKYLDSLQRHTSVHK